MCDRPGVFFKKKLPKKLAINEPRIGFFEFM